MCIPHLLMFNLGELKSNAKTSSLLHFAKIQNIQLKEPHLVMFITRLLAWLWVCVSLKPCLPLKILWIGNHWDSWLAPQMCCEIRCIKYLDHWISLIIPVGLIKYTWAVINGLMSIIAFLYFWICIFLMLYIYRITTTACWTMCWTLRLTLFILIHHHN